MLRTRSARVQEALVHYRTVLFDSASWIASDVVVLPVDTLAQRILLVSLAGG